MPETSSSTNISADAMSLEKSLGPQGSGLVSLNENLIDIIWTDRPTRPKNKIFHLDEKYSGLSIDNKIAQVREELVKKKSKAVIVTALDEVAWLFNLRGSDIDFNPGMLNRRISEKKT